MLLPFRGLAPQAWIQSLDLLPGLKSGDSYGFHAYAMDTFGGFLPRRTYRMRRLRTG